MTEHVPPLRRDAEGAAVRDLQERLGALGISIDGDAAGRFGPGTDTAVRALQAKRGLEVDGVCGPQTWAALVEAGFQLGDRLLYLTKPMLRGDDVAELQRRLSSLGFDAGRVDGIFGPDTVRALLDFQRNTGQTSDGICGPETLASLGRLGSRTMENDPVATLREIEALRGRGRRLAGARIVVGEPGGAAVLADAVGRQLTAGGAEALVLHDPDDSRQAQQANQWDGELFVALRVTTRAGIAYYGRSDYESVGGRTLAHLVARHLDRTGALALDVPPRPMTIPILRETRMPTVAISFDDAREVASSVSEVAAAVCAAVEAWTDDASTGDA